VRSGHHGKGETWIEEIGRKEREDMFRKQAMTATKSTCELDHPAHQFEFVPCCDVFIKHGAFGIVDACCRCALLDGTHALVVAKHRPAHRQRAAQE
jgi:hypothetical protein